MLLDGVWGRRVSKGPSVLWGGGGRAEGEGAGEKKRRTILVEVFVDQRLLPVSHQPDDSREQVLIRRVTGAAARVLRGAAQVVVTVVGVAPARGVGAALGDCSCGLVGCKFTAVGFTSVAGHERTVSA